VIPDEELVAAARRGDRRALGQLYERCYPSVYRFAYFHTRTIADAEDAAAETFLRAIEHVPQFRGSAAQFTGWLIRITRNAIIDRSRRTRPQVPLEEAAQLVSPDRANAVVDRVTLQLALAKLSEEQRSSVVLRFVLGLSTRETAQVLGKSDGAVEQLQRRGLAALARELGATE
jgi:RNA polymerase sigma-70 factor (ECF subfamily)